MLRPFALGLCLLSGLAAPATAISFNFTTIPGDTLTADQAAAFRTAAAMWSASLTDPFTVNVQIGFASLAPSVLGATTPSVVTASTVAVRSLLAADASSTLDLQALASLGTSTQSSLLLTTAEWKAIGGTVSGMDGKIEFSNGFSYSTARDPNGGVAPGTYDLVGIAAHEIGHLLGFVSSIDYGGTAQTLLDQFRYSGAGLRSVAAGATAYFSPDGGVTRLADFATGTVNQASHWAIGTAGVMVPELGAGRVQDITALDLQAMDVLGYDFATPVPEPWSITLLGLGLLAAARVRRRA